MLQLKSKVIISDNSGATKGEVIKVLKPKEGKIGVLGSLLLLAVKRNIPNSKIRKGTMSKALYIRSSVKTKGFSKNLKWDENRVILVKHGAKGPDLLPIGSRIKGPISSSLRLLEGTKKIVSVSKRSV